MMKTGLFGTTLCFLTLFSPAYSPAEVYQWIDARGVIHLTDNLHSVPEPVRGSPGLMIRRDFEMTGTSSGVFSPPEDSAAEPATPPKTAEAAPPAEPEQKPVAPVNVFYSRRETVVVINSTVIQTRKPRCHAPGGCQGTFRPNPADRRYIHPSAFSGGSRQFIQPELASPARR
ncbi:MAG: DUF4124 domain-containing protein [Deltaproteobacteria bacterium]|nr:DUF4124 domain-containing protein [Deltaproteobacteria bacterium]MBI2539643.1 DUF4124 domain-containing protein [Deltaproteobacteria bacterium]MBI3062113.1 DUF4124 domain-containing protein [Deltaproteobacteria bacterium]